MYITLRDLERQIKKADKGIAFQKSITKEGQPNRIIDTLTKVRADIIKEVAARQNPLNAVRCSLPKKQQRKMGLLAKV